VRVEPRAGASKQDGKENSRKYEQNNLSGIDNGRYQRNDHNDGEDSSAEMQHVGRHTGIRMHVGFRRGKFGNQTSEFSSRPVERIMFSAVC